MAEVAVEAQHNRCPENLRNIPTLIGKVVWDWSLHSP